MQKRERESIREREGERERERERVSSVKILMQAEKMSI